MDAEAGEQNIAPIVAAQCVQAEHPRRTGALNGQHFAQAIGLREVTIGEAARRVRIGGERGCGRVEVAQRIARDIRIAPQEKQAAVVANALHGVLPEDGRIIRQRCRFPQKLGVAKEPAAREPPDALRDVDAFQFHRRGLARFRHEPHAAKAEAVLLALVAGAGDVEEDLAFHEPRLLEGDPPRVVGDEADVVDRADLRQRDAVACSLINDANAKGSSRGESEDGAEKNSSEKTSSKHGGE